MPTRERIINIINIIIASNDANGGNNNNNNNNNNNKNRAYWRAVIKQELARWSMYQWAQFCAGYGGYTEAEWCAFFLVEGDYTIE